MFMSLASQFLVEDEVNFEELGNNKQTIDQEYQAYMTAPLSRMSILKFWEVGTDINGAWTLLTRRSSSTSRPIQLCS